MTFGVRKQLQAEQGMEDLEIQVKDLSAKKANLDKQRQDLLSKVDVMEKRNTEQRIYTQKKRKEEIAFMQYQGEHFNSFLKTIQAAAKPWILVHKLSFLVYTSRKDLKYSYEGKWRRIIKNYIDVLWYCGIW